LKSSHKTPLLDRRGGLWRGAEGDETEAGVVDFIKLIPPPRRARFASLICLGTPPVQEGKFWRVSSSREGDDKKHHPLKDGVFCMC